jgi:calcineurin-like phosphoesterase family protein
MNNIDPANTYFFSDPHFDHTNIIKYCHRPFKTIHDMNEALLHNYNKTVKQNSLVFFLGDMAFGRNSHNPLWWFNQLKGHIIYIKGSHDRGIYHNKLRNIEVHNYKIIKVNELNFYLVHNPADLPQWHDWVIHGHLHDKAPFIDFQRKHINVSVDAVNFKPVRLFNILRHIKDK